VSNIKTWAYLVKGVVTNVSIADADSAAAVPFPFDEVIEVGTARPSAGWTHSSADGFRPSRPYPSWTWSGSGWAPPKPAPTSPGRWVWDEGRGDWVDLEAQ
jgi:hypothetical protein